MPHYLEGYDDKGDYKEFNCLIPVRELAMISPQMFNYSYWCPVKLFCVPKIKVGFLAWNPIFFVTFVFVTKPK